MITSAFVVREGMGDLVIQPNDRPVGIYTYTPEYIYMNSGFFLEVQTRMDACCVRQHDARVLYVHATA